MAVEVTSSISLFGFPYYVYCSVGSESFFYLVVGYQTPNSSRVRHSFRFRCSGVMCCCNNT